MTQPLPPEMQGQVDAPNPLELFWEQHQRKVKIAAFVAVLIIAAVWGKQYWNTLQRNKEAAAFAELLGLDAEKVSILTYCRCENNPKRLIVILVAQMMVLGSNGVRTAMVLAQNA